MRRNLLVQAVCICMAMGLAGAHAAEPAATSPSVFKVEWNARLRHEHVNDDAFASSADATTLRLRAGVRWQPSASFVALIEGEGTAAAGDHYNSGANRQTTYPGITDPQAAELNQLWARWQGGKGAVQLGRQRLQLDDQRWIGNSGWRQNEQTFDAASFEFNPTAKVALRYHWLNRVHRAASDEAIDPLARERRLDNHLLNAAYKWGAHRLSGYAYLHDDQDVAAASTVSIGARWISDTVKDGQGWGLLAEVAQQRDYADNPLSFSHGYWRIEPALTRHGLAFRAGWEHLGGDGRHALQTPLASLHAFNGWADRFGTTPAAGLDDRYLSAGAKFGKLTAGPLAWVVAWHDYRADSGDAHYGREWNASLVVPLSKSLNGLVKVADYRADDFGRDVGKVWVQLEWVR